MYTLVLILSSDGSWWPFATKVSGPLRAHHRLNYSHIWDVRYCQRTYSTENLHPYSAPITQCTKGPTDHLWVAIEPPWRVLDCFRGRRPPTHLQPESRPVGGHHVTSHTAVLRPRDHLWMAIEPPQRVCDCFWGRCPSTHLRPKLWPVGGHHVTSCKGALRPTDHLRVAVKLQQRVSDCFQGRRPLTHLQPKLWPVGGHYVMSHTGVIRPIDHLWVAIKPLRSSQGGSLRVCKRDTGADLRLCRIDLPPSGLVVQLVWNLCKTLGFDSIQVQLLLGPGCRSTWEGEIGPSSPLAMHRVVQAVWQGSHWGCAELTFHPVDLCCNWSRILARPWASIPSRCNCCWVLSTGPHRREKLGQVPHWQCTECGTWSLLGAHLRPCGINIPPADSHCNWSRISIRPWALILRGCDWCQILAAGPHRREKVGQGSPLAMHRVWWGYTWRHVELTFHPVDSKHDWWGPCQDPGLQFCWGVIDARFRLQVPIRGRTQAKFPIGNAQSLTGVYAWNPCSTPWTQRVTCRGPCQDPGLRFHWGAINARSLPHVITGGRSVLPCQCRAATHSVMGVYWRPLRIPVLPKTLTAWLLGDLCKAPGFPSIQADLLRDPCRSLPWEGEVGPHWPLPVQRATHRVWWGFPLEATQNPPSTQQTWIATAGGALQDIRLAFHPCGIAPTAQSRVPTETFSWRTCVQAEKWPAWGQADLWPYLWHFSQQGPTWTAFLLLSVALRLLSLAYMAQ